MECSSAGVEIWAGYQLQFDGMRRFEWQDALVAEMKAELAAVKVAAGLALSGTYSCSVPARCDAENRLFTNPGATTFPPRSTAIRWERGSTVPPPPVPVEQVSGLHYYHYRAAADFELWQRDAVLARWQRVPRGLPHDGSARPSWLAPREALVAGEIDFLAPLPSDATFGLRIEVHAPAGGPRSAPALSEALVDGVLCALHAGAPSADATAVATALHAKLASQQLDHLIELITERTAVLPGSPFKISGGGIQLSPLDELCDAGEVSIRRDATTEYVRITGELFTLRPKAHPDHYAQ